MLRLCPRIELRRDSSFIHSIVLYRIKSIINCLHFKLLILSLIVDTPYDCYQSIPRQTTDAGWTAEYYYGVLDNNSQWSYRGNPRLGHQSVLLKSPEYAVVARRTHLYGEGQQPCNPSKSLSQLEICVVGEALNIEWWLMPRGEIRSTTLSVPRELDPWI